MSKRVWIGPMRSWDGGDPDLPIPEGFDDWPYRKQVYETPRYSMVDGADILGVDTATLRRWIKGNRNNGDFIPPIIEGEQRGDPYLSWFELVSAAFLDECRKTGSLHGMRTFLKALAEELDEPYPVVNEETWAVANRDTVDRIQRNSGLPQRLWLVEDRGNPWNLDISKNACYFNDRVLFDRDGLVDELVLVFHENDEDEPITVTPDRSGGVPIMRNIRIDFISGTYYAYIKDGSTHSEAAQATLEEYDYLHLTYADLIKCIDFCNQVALAA